MKKIGILTFPKSYNYGAYMQCYSLVNKIAEDFPTAKVEVIDYSSKAVQVNYDKWLHGISRRIRQPFTRNKLMIRNGCFHSAYRFIPWSDYSLVSDDYKLLFENIRDKYDVIIVGSDAVWNWNMRGFPNAYFMNAELGAKKMSYAASAYGQDYTNISMEHRKYLKEAFEKYSYIGVRDKATADFIYAIDKNLAPSYNCDPTILLDINRIPVDIDNLKIKLTRAGIDIGKPIIGLMGGEWLGKKIRKTFGDKAQIVAVYEPNCYSNAFIYDLTPFEWSRIFSLFSITFTHFFHGTLLSMKNLTPTIAIESNSSYSLKFETKIYDVMKRLGKLDCYFLREDLDRTGWQRVRDKADEIVQNQSKNRTIASFEKEAESYKDFHCSLANLIHKG